ncbi:hypothetical protein EJ07DRAFT_184020 [Lizonia empirigonia]|nr:hypothetical protein EJ07DRAFT_184020 [Lizonia empirigonia]
MSMASSPALIDRGASQMPMIQQWRTDILAAPAPAQSIRRKNDSFSRHKQEAYRQKAEARRHTIAAGVPQPQAAAPTKRAPGPLPTPSPPRTKTAPPAKRAPRPLPTPGPPRAKAAPPTKRRENGPAPGASKPKRHKARPASTSAAQAKSSTKAVPADAAPVSPPPEDPEIEIVPPPPTFDELSQTIVSDYDDYKWSVYHYELQPISGYAFAESWLHELFNTTLHDSYTNHHVSHASRGFIADGTRLSMLVLHNAANPFITSHPPSNTITIGVYGYHWHTHSTIHWTTLAGDHRPLITQCLAANFLSEKRRWSANSPAPHKHASTAPTGSPRTSAT